MYWQELDHSVFFWVNQHHAWWLDWPLITSSWLGELGIVWIIIAIFLLIKRSRWAPYLTSLLFGTVIINDGIIHNITHRIRPYLALDNVRTLGWPWDSSSFVSGHAIMTVAAAIFVQRAFPRYSRIAWIFTALTLYGRVYAGMHYPVDVIAGTLVGIMLGLIMLYASDLNAWELFMCFINKHISSWGPLLRKIWRLRAWRYSIIGIPLIFLGIVTVVKLAWFGALLTLALVILNVLVYQLLKLTNQKVGQNITNWNRFRSGVIFSVLLLLVVESAFAYSYIWRYAIDKEPLPEDRYVVLIVADGASLVKAKELFLKGSNGDDYWKAANANFPTIAQNFIQNGAYTANGISIWPSSSVPAHTAIMTGSYPRNTDIVGQRQFDRQTRKHTSYIGLGILQQREILDEARKTLCEYFPNTRSLAVLQVANRGCSLYIPGNPSDELVLNRTEQAYAVSESLGKLTGKNEIPRILVVTLPDVDHQTHSQPLSTEKMSDLYKGLDESVKRVMDLYRQKGIYDKTLFVLAADHGMGEVDKHVTLDNLVHDLRFDSFAALKWKANPAWGNFEANTFVGTKYRFEHINNAIPLWGGNSDGTLYIKGQNIDDQGKVVRENWDIKASEENLHNYIVGGVRVDLIARLLEYSPGVGLISTNPSPGKFKIYSSKGSGVLEERSGAEGLEYRYTIEKGTDPLGIKSQAALMAIQEGVWLSDHRWLELLYLEHNPDAFRRISFAFGSDYSADLNIVAADGWDFTPYYVSNHVLVGSHGSLNQDQSYVPIMFHGPGIKSVEMPYARTVDILPTILAYLGKNVTRLPLDGIVLPIFNNAPIQTYDIGKPVVVSNGNQYKLRGVYGSYDRQLLVKRSGGWIVAIPSLRAYFTQEVDKLNVVFENIKAVEGSADVLSVEKLYAAEEKSPETLTIDLNIRNRTVSSNTLGD